VKYIFKTLYVNQISKYNLQFAFIFIEIFEAKRIELHLTNVLSDHSQTYSCKANNGIGGTVSRSIKLIVKGIICMLTNFDVVFMFNFLNEIQLVASDTYSIYG
jgi:hypothetical protein